MSRRFCSLAVLASPLALALALAASPAQASVSDADYAAMAQLVQRQAQRIDELEKRLDTVEGKAQIPAAGPAPAASSTPSRAGVGSAAATGIVAVKNAANTGSTQAPAPDFKVSWANGAPTFSKSDGSFTFKPRGRLLVDLDSTFGSDLASRNVTTTGLRAARLGVEGTFLHHGLYQLEADFIEGQATLMGAFVGYQGRIGKVEFDARIGNIFNDRSIEGQTGSLTTPFIERNFVANAVLPQKGYYGIGTMARFYGRNWHASVHVSGDAIDGAYAVSDTLTVASRAHWNPIKGDNGTLHLGLWGFHERLSDAARTITRNTAIGARFDSTLRVSTGPLTDAKSSTGYGAELVGVYRQFYVWGEYGRRDLKFLPTSPVDDFATTAWSVSGGWFLTGEKPPYSGRQGNFAAPKIRSSLANGGIGAIEILARHERLDYSDTPLGGTGEETTLGVNWYPVPLVRFMLNWSRWNVDNRVAPLVGKDSGNSITTRAQVNF